MSESEFGSFHEPPIEEEYILDNSCEWYFSQIDSFPEWFVFFATRYSSNTSQIDPGFRYLDSTSNIEISIMTLEVHTREFAHHGNEEFQFSLTDTTSRTLGVSELGIGSECLYLDEDGAISLNGKCECRTRENDIFLIDKLETRIRKIDESLLLHPKQSNAICRSEPILQCSEDTVVLRTNSFEK